MTVAAPTAGHRVARRSSALVCAALGVCLVVACAVDVLIGQAYSPGDFVRAVAGGDDTARSILVDIRGPRVVTALLVGLALGAAGYALQAVVNNPIASPDLLAITPIAILGLLAGAATGLISLDQVAGPMVACGVGAGVGVGLVLVLMFRASGADVVSIGVVVSAVTSGVIVLLLATQEGAFGSAFRLLVGAVDGRVWAHIAWATPAIVAGVVVLVVTGPWLMMCAAGPAHTHAVGLGPWRSRLVVLVGVALAVTGATALAGSFGFVGLLAGHLGRQLVGLRPVGVVPVAALVGAVLVVACDAVAQFVTLMATRWGEVVGVPAGAVATICGAALLTYLLTTKGHRSW